MHTVSTVQYERIKQISKTEGEPFTSSLNICPEACCKKGWSMHREKRLPSFPSPAGMSRTKLPLGRNNSVMTSLFPPRESLVVTSRLGTGNSRTFFLRCGGGRGNASPSLTTAFFPYDPWIFISRRRNRYSPPRCFPHVCTV